MNDNEDFSREKAMKQYLILVHEIGMRIDLVIKACNGALNLTPPFAREYAYLQFISICELIALGSSFCMGIYQRPKRKRQKESGTQRRS